MSTKNSIIDKRLVLVCNTLGVNQADSKKICDVNNTASIISFCVLLDDIFPRHEIPYVIREKSGLFNQSLLETLYRPNGVSAILSYIEDKGYLIPVTDLKEYILWLMVYQF